MVTLRFSRPALMTLMSLTMAISAPLLASSDGALSESITERVTAAWGDQPAGIIVKVRDGVVEMWGEAPSAQAADEAVQIARSTVGVRDVISHLNSGKRLGLWQRMSTR